MTLRRYAAGLLAPVTLAAAMLGASGTTNTTATSQLSDLPAHEQAKQYAACNPPILILDDRPVPSPAQAYDDISEMANRLAPEHAEMLLNQVLVESSYRILAVSPVGAVGPSQIMPSTGQDLELKVLHPDSASHRESMDCLLNKAGKESTGVYAKDLSLLSEAVQEGELPFSVLRSHDERFDHWLAFPKQVDYMLGFCELGVRPGRFAYDCYHSGRSRALSGKLGPAGRAYYPAVKNADAKATFST